MAEGASDNQEEHMNWPLSELFERARVVHEQNEASPSSTENAEAARDQAVAWFSQASALIDKLGLFSANEEKDDLATGSLKYLLVPYYSANLLAATSLKEPAQRSGKLREALRLYSQFLHTCDRHGLLGPQAHAAMEAQEQGARLDVQTTREQKVARFKREREIKQRLAQILARHRSAVPNDEEGQEGGDDEEQHREALLLSIDLATIKAIDQRSMLQQEIDMLQHIAALPPDQRTRPAGPEQLQLLPKLLAAAGQLQSQRERSAAGVFRPSHHLPTVTLEEFAAREVADMQRRQEAEALQAAAKSANGDNSDGEDEEELHKARAWDDWKDDNPRGWGNSKLRPTA